MRGAVMMPCALALGQSPAMFQQGLDQGGVGVLVDDRDATLFELRCYSLGGGALLDCVLCAWLLVPRVLDRPPVATVLGAQGLRINENVAAAIERLDDGLDPNGVRAASTAGGAAGYAP